MKTNVKKSILSAAFMVAIISICFTANARPVLKMATTAAVSDTGKMDKMSKMSKMSKTDKMKKKKMDKMSSGKMSKMKKDTSKM